MAQERVLGPSVTFPRGEVAVCNPVRLALGVPGQEVDYRQGGTFSPTTQLQISIQKAPLTLLRAQQCVHKTMTVESGHSRQRWSTGCGS